MVTEIDYTVLKNQIITILKADSILWDNITNGANGTFTKIERGLPSNNTFEGLSYPICFVTNSDDLEIDKPFGPVSANSAGASEHNIFLQIIFFDLAGDGQATEDSLDALHKRIKEVLKANNNLNGLVTWSWTNRSKVLNFDHRGKSLDGRIILLECKIHTN